MVRVFAGSTGDRCPDKPGVGPQFQPASNPAKNYSTRDEGKPSYGTRINRVFANFRLLLLTVLHHVLLSWVVQRDRHAH
jgi:hypothetical protein